MPWIAEDGFPVRGRVCEECPFVGIDKAQPEFVRKWFERPTEVQDSRVYCHMEGGSYHPATDEDRGCRGFYAAAKRLGVFNPAKAEGREVEP